MSFLAPFWLGLAGLAAVPLLIHLLRRRIGTRIEFPAARYLRRAEEEHSRDLKVRNLILMLLRVLAILALALAAARPAARLPGGGHAPTALAIVVDNSLSTSVVMDGAPALTSGDAATIVAAIARLQPLAGAGDLPGAVRRAAGLARTAGLQAQEIVVVTDGQASTWREGLALGELRALVFAPAGAPPPNRAVVDAAARPPRWTPRGAVTAKVRGTGDSTTWRVTLMRRTLARGTVVADARGADVVVSATPPERGWVSGTVELEPDELRGDDVGHWAAWIGAAPALAVSAGAGPFARSAGDALVQGGLARPGGDVALAAAEDLVRLPALVAAPLDPVRVGAANRALERAGIPWRFGTAVRGESRVQSADSLLARGTTVALRYALVPAGAGATDTLARVGREPWVVAGPGYVLLASPLDPGATSLPVRAAFVPWVAQMLALRLGGEAGALAAATPGGRVAAPAGADALEAADGRITPVVADSVSAPAVPGVYLLRRGERRVGALVVNVEAEETDLRRMSKEQLEARLEGRAVTVVEGHDDFVRRSYGAGARRPLAAVCLGVALAALLAESLLAGRATLARRADAAAAPRAATA